MSWSSKVIWSEGMFLQPQHLQQHDRYLSRLVESRGQSLAPYAWGFVRLQLDDASAELGKIAITSADGVLPDGTPFDFPSVDRAPLPLEIASGVRDQRVVLAIPMQRAGTLEADLEGHDRTGLTRLLPIEIEVRDSTLASADPVTLQVGSLRMSLMLESQATDAYSTLAFCRIEERRADGSLALDRTFVPPTLAIRNQDVLAGYVAEIVGKMHRQGDELGKRLAHPGRGGVAEIAEFLLLQTINRFEPVFAHLGELATLHPSVLYRYCLMLAGDLSTFSRESRRPEAYPPYVHDDLKASFGPVMNDLRHSLSMEHQQNAIPIELVDRKFVRVARINDPELLRTASFVLAVNAQMAGDTLRARFPTQVKVGPVERIRDLVNLALPGIVLRAQPVAPRQLPYHAGFTYFELERNGELWKQLQGSGGLAIHIAGEFPGLEMEFWAIRG